MISWNISIESTVFPFKNYPLARFDLLCQTIKSCHVFEACKFKASFLNDGALKTTIGIPLFYITETSSLIWPTKLILLTVNLLLVVYTVGTLKISHLLVKVLKKKTTCTPTVDNE